MLKEEYKILEKIINKASEVAKEKYNINKVDFFTDYSKVLIRNQTKYFANREDHSVKEEIDIGYKSLDLLMRYYRRYCNGKKETY